MFKSSLTPNVILQCDVPQSVDKSFVRGQVYVTLSDSVFKSSSPFRHGVMQSKVYKGLRRQPRVVMKYTDGGTDQRNTLETIKLATICLFKELDPYVDMIIAGRCAPGHSYVNPAERIMSLLNIGVQNCATERERGLGEFEREIKPRKSMKEIREHKVPGIDVEENWIKSVKPVQEMISSRFKRLTLKDVPFQCVPVVMKEEISDFQRHISDLFPGMDINKLTKKPTQKNAFYQESLSSKLQKAANPSTNADNKDGQEGESRNATDEQKHKNESCSMSAQMAQAVVTCVGCRKPRVIYSSTKLDYRHKMMLARNMSSFEYSCGSFLFPPMEKRKLTIAMTVRLNLTCGIQVELPYYGDNGDLGRKDICSHCEALTPK